MLFRRRLQCTLYVITVQSTSWGPYVVFYDLYVTTVQSTSWGPYVVFYDLKPVNEDGNLQLWKLCMMHKKELLKYTSEHVKSQFPRGHANKPPTHN